MAKLTHPSPELAFLNWVNSSRNEEYRSAWWLKSHFDDAEWLLDFGYVRHKLSFAVRLSDQSLLTSPQHHQLLTVIKCWLCIQTHPDVTGARPLGSIPSHQAVSRVLRLVDHLLINSARFEIARFGLAAVSKDDFVSILASLGCNGDTAQSIYDWNQRVSAYLRKQLNSISQTELAEFQRSTPDIFVIDIPSSERVLGFDDSDLVKARAFLWRTGMYQKGGGGFGYRHQPSSPRLLEQVLPDTIWATHTRLPLIEELCVGKIERYVNEYERVPVRTAEENALSDSGLALWVAAIRSLGLLDELDLPVPVSALEQICSRSLAGAITLKTQGRFATIPQEFVLRSIRQSVEFTLSYGEDIVESYLRIACAAHKAGRTVARYCTENGIAHLLTPKLLSFGVKTWNLSSAMALSEANPMRDTPRGRAVEYFSRFRANEGFVELVSVLYGAIQLCVGVLSARRQGELIDLQVGLALDSKAQYLIFSNRKTGVVGLRETEARPIPPICAKMIGLLERMQTGLLTIGALDKPGYVFAQPNRKSISFSVCHSTYNRALDTFCDYFESPMDDRGRRFYVRQHQLRRFFSMLFFWGRAYGGLETLRWFLGHTDVEHVYHYITESTPGAVLRTAKASFGAEALRNAEESAADLANLVERHFGTRQFAVLDSTELEEYINDLLETRAIEIEPQFFTSPEGKTFKVIIKVISEKI